MVDRGAITKIKIRMERFSDSERKVADYVMANLSEIPYKTLIAIAKDTGVSDATVMRFVRSIGFETSNSFKIAVTTDIQSPNEAIFSSITPEDSLEIVATKVIQSDILLLQDTINLVDIESLENVLKLILKSKRILLFATGTSRSSGMWLFDRLLRLGFPVLLLLDPFHQLTQAALSSYVEDELCIFISRSGSPQMLIEAQQVLRQSSKKIKIVTITCDPNSVMARQSDYCLFAGSHETQIDVAGSQVGIISIINTIYISLANIDAQRTAVQQAKIWNAVDVFRRGPRKYRKKEKSKNG